MCSLNSLGHRRTACQILDIMSFFIIVSSLFVRFPIDHSLDLVSRRLGPWISSPIVSWYWPSATYMAAPWPIPPQTTGAGGCRTPPEVGIRTRTLVLKSLLFLTSLFNASQNWFKKKLSKNTSKIDVDFRHMFNRLSIDFFLIRMHMHTRRKVEKGNC